MTDHAHDSSRGCCCDSSACAERLPKGMTRRDFLAAAGIGISAMSMSPLLWHGAVAAEATAPPAPQRTALTVKAILAYEIPGRRPQTSWRNWGGIQTQEDAQAEIKRIGEELAKIQQSADFPLTVLPVSGVRGAAEIAKIEDVAGADTIIIYAAGGSSAIIDAALKTGKNVIIFLRHRSGPVYLWYEIISPRYLHGHGDALATKGIDNGDVVVDSADELAWRLRALCGLKNALGMKIVAIGGPGGWGPGGGKAPQVSRDRWKLDISTVTYEQLAPMLADAMKDDAAVKLAAQRAADYLKDPLVKLETERQYVENAFLLDQVFRSLMAAAGARAMTINNCMSAIMPISKTTACLTLSLLNDAGYLAFCESDFVVIPAGMLLASIAGRPHFLNDPTYPHAGLITLAHCTSPRRLDGKTLEPARIVTHFESDYGASPKVEMKKGQVVTNVIPDFASARYVGFLGEIVESPFLPICRSQVEVSYKFADDKLALNMPGFHWETIYGDWMREMGYALKKIPIGWQVLS